MPPHAAPIDGTLDLCQLVDSFFTKDWTSDIYTTLVHSSGQGDLVDISWPEFARAIHRGAHYINPLTGSVPQKGTGNVIGIYAVTDVLVYVTLIMAVIRSGNIVRSSTFPRYVFFNRTL